ncbi:hypothetical protein NQZ68_012538 [Dissostichus eleginoides]|nr:hypothetical protein NQZ68_012538 [Dissostichus eleginoides]
MRGDDQLWVSAACVSSPEAAAEARSPAAIPIGTAPGCEWRLERCEPSQALQAADKLEPRPDDDDDDGDGDGIKLTV